MSESPDVSTRSPQPAGGRIFAFYSHTGGTGRSLTLATVAWILASAGHRVLAVDWSLGAPSLHRFLAPFLRDRELRSTSGIVEMITELMVDGLSSPRGEAAADATWVRRHALVINHCVSLDYDFPGPGALDLLPAGRQSPGYNSRVAMIDWNHFYQRHRGGAFLGLLRESMLEHYDYVLIDTMNGGAPPAALVTGLLADTVVVCARASNGSIEGAAAAARSILAQPGIRRRQVLPALLQVDRTDQERADATLRFAEQQRWSDLLPGTSPLRIAEIPYSTELAFEEIIASFAGTSSSAAKVLRACEGLVASLTDGAVVGSADLELLGARHLVDLYRRMVPTAVPTELEGDTSHVVISYVAYDRLWAEWLKEQLERAGVGSRLAGNANLDVELGDLPPGTRVLALLSQRYLESRHARAVWQSVLGQEAAAGRRIIVPLRLDYASPDGQFARYAYLDLAAKDSLTARNAVLTTLGRELPEDDEAALDALSASYPRGNVPWIATNLDQRNENFFGRSNILEELRDTLDLTATEDPIEGAKVLPVVVLHAADGIGKGEIAHEYAYRFAPEYDVVWLLPGEPAADLRGALAALAKELGVNPPGHDDQSVVRETVASVGDRRVLLIFEYANDPQPIIELLPTHAIAAQVIICAQQPAGEHVATDIKIGLFDRDESLQFLRSRGVELSDELEYAIADRVRDLPIALEQAAVALAGGMTADQYTRSFDGWIQAVAEPEDHQRALFAAWLVTLDRLRSIDAPTADLLELCACFGPGAIPEELLRGVNVMESLGLQSHERDRLEGMLDRLHDLSLARIQPGSRSVELHRLLRRTVQAQLSGEKRVHNQTIIAEALAKADPGDTEDAKNWPTYERLLPHVQACTLGSRQDPVRHLLANSVRAAWRSGSWTAGMNLADAALDAWDEQYDDDNDTFVLLMRYHRVNILWSQGDFTGVREQATDIRERFELTMGPNAEYTLITATILAASERALGHFERSRELDRDTLDRLRASVPVRNRRRLNAAHNLADSERLMGQYAVAQRLDEETLQRRITWLGYEHSWTLQSLASLGYDLRALGELQSSAENLTIALAGLERVVGIRHEDTIRTRKSLAAARRRLDQLDDAAILINQAVSEADAIFPTNHPDLLAILLERAAVLAAIGRYDDAWALARDVMERFGQRFENDDNDAPHPFRLAAEVNYVAYLRRVRRTTKAGLNAARRVYADLARVLELRHPWAVLARVNIGNYLFDLGEFSEAHAVDEATYLLAQEVLGPDHPDTFAAGINLVISSAGNHHDSVTAALSGSLTATAEEKFGFHHRIARAARERKRCDCDLELPPL